MDGGDLIWLNHYSSTKNRAAVAWPSARDDTWACSPVRWLWRGDLGGEGAKMKRSLRGSLPRLLRSSGGRLERVATAGGFPTQR
jgi:hypothetical protein